MTVHAKVGDPSPWGVIDFAKILLPGLVDVCTPSHGGIVATGQVAEKIRATFPDFHPWVESTPDRLWLEEDCDWVVAALVFPDAFTPENTEAARIIASKSEYLHKMGVRT